MKRKLVTFLTAGAVSAAALGGGMAFADNKGDDQAEVQAFMAAPQSLTQAISAAEAASGGTAVGAEFDHHKRSSFYEVDTIANGRQISVEIDASTGAVIKTEDEGDVANADDDDIVDPAQLGAPLAALIATAEQASGGGKVMSIKAEHENGPAPEIEVEIANADGSAQEYTMAADGSLTPQADD